MKYLTDRWVVLVGAAVATVVLLAAGERLLACAVIAAGLWAASLLGPRREVDGERLFSPELRAALLERDGQRCAYCARRVHYEGDCPTGGCDTCFQADHVKPWAASGGTTLDNGVVACRWCNQHKSARPVGEFLWDPDGDGAPGI